jgi:hypothetical protein
MESLSLSCCPLASATPPVLLHCLSVLQPPIVLHCLPCVVIQRLCHHAVASGPAKLGSAAGLYCCTAHMQLCRAVPCDAASVHMGPLRRWAAEGVSRAGGVAMGEHRGMRYCSRVGVLPMGGRTGQSGTLSTQVHGWF